MTSSRLPGKVMLPLAGAPLLLRMIERVQAAKIDATLAILTSTQASDDSIERLCKQLDVPCYRGHLIDLLDRHYQAAKHFEADVIAKIPSDCPLIDPDAIRRVFAKFDEGDYDYVSNLHPATYPDGNDVEVFTFETLEAAWEKATLDFEREHTTPFIWERPDRFRVGNATWETGLDYSMTHRWTIDYPEDYEFISRVYDHLWSSNKVFSIEGILALLQREPSLRSINARYVGVNWYRKHLDALKTVNAEQTKVLEEEINW
jgi:spore coat polysaccharide biosynthesis protein SpsF